MLACAAGTQPTILFSPSLRRESPIWAGRVLISGMHMVGPDPMLKTFPPPSFLLSSVPFFSRTRSLMRRRGRSKVFLSVAKNSFAKEEGREMGEQWHSFLPPFSPKKRKKGRERERDGSPFAHSSNRTHFNKKGGEKENLCRLFASFLFLFVSFPSAVAATVPPPGLFLLLTQGGRREGGKATFSSSSFFPNLVGENEEEALGATIEVSYYRRKTGRRNGV